MMQYYRVSIQAASIATARRDQDLEPMLAEKLDILCKGLRKRFPGGAEEAWEELELSTRNAPRLPSPPCAHYHCTCSKCERSTDTDTDTEL